VISVRRSAIVNAFRLDTFPCDLEGSRIPSSFLKRHGGEVNDEAGWPKVSSGGDVLTDQVGTNDTVIGSASVIEE
jgi:hypothetical protein